MIEFLKKLFGSYKPEEKTGTAEAAAPYKVEAPATPVVTEAPKAEAVVAEAPKKARKPAKPKAPAAPKVAAPKAKKPRAPRAAKAKTE